MVDLNDNNIADGDELKGMANQAGDDMEEGMDEVSDDVEDALDVDDEDDMEEDSEVE